MTSCIEAIYHWGDRTGGNRDRPVSWRNRIIAIKEREEIEREGFRDGEVERAAEGDVGRVDAGVTAALPSRALLNAIVVNESAIREIGHASR